MAEALLRRKMRKSFAIIFRYTSAMCAEPKLTGFVFQHT
jgi:hypothetical protein